MLKKLLITGANGNLGAVCRDRLTHITETMRVAARKGLGEARENEEIVYCSLEDKAAVEAMVEGCDGIVHMGGQATEASWSTIRAANLDGMYNLYEAARKSSVTPRIVFASSNHAIGFHKQSERLDAKSLTRPDGLYGVSKVFGEALASMYHDKFGIETASVRIGSCFPEPVDHRMLSTWMSHDDFIQSDRTDSSWSRDWAVRSSMASRPIPRPGGTTAKWHTWAGSPRTTRRFSAKSLTPKWIRRLQTM